MPTPSKCPYWGTARAIYEIRKIVEQDRPSAYTRTTGETISTARLASMFGVSRNAMAGVLARNKIPLNGKNGAPYENQNRKGTGKSTPDIRLEQQRQRQKRYRERKKEVSNDDDLRND